MMQENSTGNPIRVLDTTANAAPLGLLAFGMTTVLLNLHNAGLFSMGSVIFAMGIFYGGLAQIIAGIMEWKKNNTFAATAFISYGFFWITLVFIILMPVFGWGGVFSKEGFIAFLAVWGLFLTGDVFDNFWVVQGTSDCIRAPHSAVPSPYYW